MCTEERVSFSRKKPFADMDAAEAERAREREREIGVQGGGRGGGKGGGLYVDVSSPKV